MEPDVVVAGLYEAAALPDQWSNSLAAVAAFTHSKASHFFEFDPSTGIGSWGAVGWVPGAGLDPAADELWRAHYAKIDPRQRLVLRDAGQIWSCAEAFADHVIPGVAELYNDFLVPNGLRWTLAYGAHLPGGRALFLSGLRGPAEGAYGAEEKRRLSCVTSHIALVYRLRERLARAGALAALALDVLEHSDTGYVVCDAAARVIYANPAAVTLGHGQLVFSRGHVSALRPAVEAELTAHIRTAATPSPRTENGIGHAMRIERGNNLGDLYILVAPLPPRATPDGVGTGPSVLLIIEPGRPGTAPLGRHLVDWFGLSPAEARLALDLLAGSRLQDIAERRALRISTLRTQLSQILAKTGTTRQAELLALLANLPKPRSVSP